MSFWVHKPKIFTTRSYKSNTSASNSMFCDETFLCVLMREINLHKFQNYSCISVIYSIKKKKFLQVGAGGPPQHSPGPPTSPHQLPEFVPPVQCHHPRGQDRQQQQCSEGDRHVGLLCVSAQFNWAWGSYTALAVDEAIGDVPVTYTFWYKVQSHLKYRCSLLVLYEQRRAGCHTVFLDKQGKIQNVEKKSVILNIKQTLNYSYTFYLMVTG